MTATTGRLTAHQRHVLDDLRRRSGRLRSCEQWGWVAAADLGSRTALEHLVTKGYAERDVRIGPLGGEHRFYRPIGAPS